MEFWFRQCGHTPKALQQHPGAGSPEALLPNPTPVSRQTVNSSLVPPVGIALSSRHTQGMGIPCTLEFSFGS